MWIHIYTLLDGILDLQVDSSENIGQLKIKLENLRGYPQICQNLVFKGKLLKDNQVIEEFKLKNDNYLILLVRVCFIIFNF